MVAPTELGDLPRGPDKTGSFRWWPRQNWETVAGHPTEPGVNYWRPDRTRNMAIGDPTELDFVPVVTRQNREFFGGVPTELGVCTCKYRFVPTELGDIFTYPTELG